MKKLLIPIFMVVAGAVQAMQLNVAFPPEGSRWVGINQIYVIGSCATNEGPLYVNGEETVVYPTGCFLAMVPLKEGTNDIVLEQGLDTFTRHVKVSPPSTEPGKPSKIHDVYADLNIPRDTPVPSSPPYGKPPSEVLIMIDPGHGGSELGAISPHGWCEKEVNLSQAKEVAKALRQLGYRVVLTREKDELVPIYNRPKRAFSEHVDAFISIHHNATAANTNPREVRHTITYAWNEMGLALARCIQAQVAPVMEPVRNGDVRVASFAVCRNPVVPSCLVEVDFINLPEGEEESWQVARQQRVAQAVARGVKDWLTPPKVEANK